MAKPLGDSLTYWIKISVIKRRTIHLWVALLLALLFPLSACGQLFSGTLLFAPGNPASSQSSNQHEEDETHSHAKVAVVQAIRRKRGRLLLGRRVSVLPALSRDTEADLPRTWVPAAPFRLPSTLHLESTLAHRGPPTA